MTKRLKIVKIMPSGAANNLHNLTAIITKMGIPCLYVAHNNCMQDLEFSMNIKIMTPVIG